VKPGDFVRLRKSHPAVKNWRRGHLTIGQWAEADSPLLLLFKHDYSDTRWEVLGPGGQLASFDDYLFTTRGVL
jgi:hypothetical protein